ncbi:TetR/AcrR family transcriptional regulator [Pseudactinotalea sp. HY158]|uniref:TetR/AcrR family transcriptional regulator n=1 Tax=Pseudactinotalea sp. HY158 TaxID=2654547 RepID=UPI00129C5B6C|nr:TetR/AcrR family transcriptional regulator [Pseudactinotalea sp. HY158]QGH68148.1 TetR family transcriptional regulator [Pseudactinotalea sp. HY158]
MRAEAGTRARERILDAAAVLFAQRGFDGSSTARIAHAAGVPKGLLFYYFPTKPDILGALLEERFVVAPFDTGPLTVRGDPAQTLMNLSERVLRNHAESEILREIIWHESHTRPEVLAALTRYRQALNGSIQRALAASLPGHINEDVIRAAAAAWAALITARPLGGEGDGRGAIHAVANLRAVAQLLTAGLRAAPAGA